MKLFCLLDNVVYACIESRYQPEENMSMQIIIGRV